MRTVLRGWIGCGAKNRKKRNKRPDQHLFIAHCVEDDEALEQKVTGNRVVDAKCGPLIGARMVACG